MTMNVDPESDSEFSESSEIHSLDFFADSDEQVLENVDMETENEMLSLMNNTFDSTLPTSHSYLGHNLEELRGRTVLDDGIYMNLPVLVKQSVVLFPGQTLPMKIFGPETINMLKTCIQNDHTFGVVCLAHDKTVPIGTTAEIYEYQDGDPIQGFCLKAKGRQRFKVLRINPEGNGKISAHVKVLPEIILGPPFLDERLASINHLRLEATNEEDLKKLEKVEKLDAMVTPWPAWVYKQYDPLRLSLRIREHLKFIEVKGGGIPKDPTELSFWVAQNILLDNSERAVLLNYDCAISRLQREIKCLNKHQVFVCSTCDTVIGKQSNMFPMSRDGPQNAYCNSGGVIHETITLYRAQGLILDDNPPSTECSWFPGYAWSIAYCESCSTHMGWRFTATQNDLQPRGFWGLTRRSLKNLTK